MGVPMARAAAWVILALWLYHTGAMGRSNKTCASLELTVDLREGEASEAHFLRAIAENAKFRTEMWGQKPTVLRPSTTDRAFAGWLTLAELQAFVSASGSEHDIERSRLRWIVTKGDQKLFEVADADEDSLFGAEDLLKDIANSTVVFNTLGLLLPKLGELCKVFRDIFELPASANVYVTGMNHTVSARPHNDLQDVFILQTQGSKHWKVWGPPIHKPHFLHVVGKQEGHEQDDTALGSPLLDVMLHAGDLLYVPRGFVHSTSTPPPQLNEAPSLHITMNLETVMVRQTYEAMALCAYAIISNEVDTLDDSSWDVLQYHTNTVPNTTLRDELPLGRFLSATIPGHSASNMSWKDDPLVERFLMVQLRRMFHERGWTFEFEEGHLQHDPWLSHPLDAILMRVSKLFIIAHQMHLDNNDYAHVQGIPFDERQDYYDENYAVQTAREVFAACGFTKEHFTKEWMASRLGKGWVL